MFYTKYDVGYVNVYILNPGRGKINILYLCTQTNARENILHLNAHEYYSLQEYYNILLTVTLPIHNNMIHFIIIERYTHAERWLLLRWV